MVLRLAEMYLVLAEIEAEQNGGPTDRALRLLNYVRRRSANETILPEITKENKADPSIKTDNRHYSKDQLKSSEWHLCRNEC